MKISILWCCAIIGATGLCQAQSISTVQKRLVGQRWVGTWATSVQQIDDKELPPPPGLTDTTIRQIVRVSLGGKAIRLRLSNAFGAYNDGLKILAARVAISAGHGAIQPETEKEISFRGQRQTLIQRGAIAVSDPLDFDLAPQEDLAITLYIQDAAQTVSGHRSARGTTYLQSGNVVSQHELPTATKTTQWYYLSGVDVLAPQEAGAVVALGDSITDGKGSGDDTNRRWTDFLARRLLANPATKNIGVLNQGIGGGALYRGGIGQNALTRFDRDVLAQPGARWLIVLEGINDLGGKKTTADELITALEQVAVRARDRDLRVIGGTIMPCGGSNYLTPEGEAARQTINQWIRTSGAFDAVVDFDAAVRDPQDPSRLLPATDSGDHLHPNAEGYRLMAESVDLKLLAP